jgi:hydroxymethylpyrimidine pyrophosphatase-like HAD family hydrolase
VAFGDDINDVEMLQAAGLGVAVANAFPGALAVARRIAPANTEDGVAQVMEELMNVND